jgi:hypothetical protein
METLHKREKELVGQKIISKQDACSGVHTGLAVGKIPSQYSKKTI